VGQATTGAEAINGGDANYRLHLFASEGATAADILYVQA